jgi:hypothetical protein
MKWPKKDTKTEEKPEADEALEVGEEVDSKGKEKEEKENEERELDENGCPPSIGKKFCQQCRLEIPIKSIRCYHCHADQVLKGLLHEEEDQKEVRFTGFKLLLSDIVDDDDPEAGTVFTDVEFKIKDKHLLNSLSRQGISVAYRDQEKEKKKEGEENKTGYIKAELLIYQLPKIRAYWANEKNSVVRNFLAQIEHLQKSMIKQIKALLKKSKTVFPALWFIFEEGTQIYSWKGGCKLGSTIVSSSYSGSFSMRGEMLKSDGEQFYWFEETFSIWDFYGVRRLEDLDVQLMDAESMDELIARGQLFNELGLGHKFRSYNGFMTKRYSSYFSHKVPVEGRVMLDAATYNRMYPSDASFRSTGTRRNKHKNRKQAQQQYQYDNWGGSQAQPASDKFRRVPPEDLFMCWPTLPGFSFKKKQWGEFFISLCHEIKFDDKAFDQLVLEQNKKDLIKSLVECQENQEVQQRGFSDIISGKGGGCIFLLHGKPGTGKTLTAEAVSEHLHTPLYSVSVGELGTTPESLETKLQKILEVAGIWKASILMDEADIFLERRTKSDIMRNAMVGIFLRLLEYHNGVLFLTTNRIKSIDEAFNSRISIALHYDDLDRIARGAVWQNFIDHLKDAEGADAIADDLDMEELVDYDLNGRQIRSTVKLSQSLAVYQKRPLSMEHLRSTISVALCFEQKFEETVKAKRREKHYYKNRLDQKDKDEAARQKKKEGKGKGKGKAKKITVAIGGSSDYDSDC